MSLSFHRRFRLSRLSLRYKRFAIDEEPGRSQYTQAHRQCLSRLDRSWDTASGEDDTCEERKLDAILLFLRDAVTSIDILGARQHRSVLCPEAITHQCADGQASGDGRHRACSNVACDTADRSQGAQNEGGYF